MTQRMILNETSWFGRGCRNQLIHELTRRGFSRALIVTDSGLVKCGIVGKITTQLDEAGFAWTLFDRVVPNPGITVVQEGVAKFRASGADVLIAIGGGSPQDTCKAIGIIINNPEFEDVRSLEGLAETTRPCVPVIALPTTAGTAAEVTINYVITDEEQQRKFVCIDPHDIPQVALVDADLMDAMPGSLKASTGIDALTHAIEGYITRGAWELPDALHLKSIEMIAKSLRSAVAGDAQAMEKMALAQYIAGMGFSNVGLGLVHGMAHPLGAFYNTPHGVANAILLPGIMAWNAAHTGEKYRDIALAMAIPDAATLPLERVRQAVVDAVCQLNRDVGIPTSLREIGMNQDDIPQLALAAFNDVCTGGNPRQATVEDIAALYQQAFNGANVQ
ncbi:lactaldehyde reductase [Citrobacter amalonaticus]|uniref:lactaldehyde reductase n=1 Tax=Citrobacter amalonaticus TaxID=35703 RepID=UPI0020A1EB63|nr:lactaldehyde reductase [Citrobacter amalonaticus]MCP1627563.1 lactaldehyde reductase [Citrobacter amalonaticus]